MTVLESAGYRRHQAVSGDDAYRFWRRTRIMRIDLLFTDVVMPGRSTESISPVRRRFAAPGLQVLFTSGFPNLVREHADEELRQHVLRKPYPRRLFVRGAILDCSRATEAPFVRACSIEDG